MKDLQQKIPSFANCDNYGIRIASNPNPLNDDTKTNDNELQRHKMQTIHHFALLLFKNYLTIQVSSLQRIHRQYIRYKSMLDDTLIGIENLNLGYLTHCILDLWVLSKFLETIEGDLEDTAPEYEPVFTSVYQ